MASTYTAAGIELVTQGEQAGAWGDTTNTNWEMIEEMVGGVVSVALSTTSETLTTSDGASSDGRHAAVVFTGSPGGTCTVTVSPNDMQKIYFIVNNSDQTVALSQGSGANVSIAAGSKKIVYCDGAGAGAAVVDLTTNLDISGLHLGGTEVTATATELNYVDGVTSAIQTQLDAMVEKAGDTMTGFLTLHADPTSNLHAATKSYVDEVAQGVALKPAADAASTANISGTYDNGTAGVGSTMTFAAAASFTVTFDTVGQGLLLKDQTSALQNGRYYLSTVGDAGTAWVFTRCGYCDTSDEIPGGYIFIQGGTANASTGWVMTVADAETFTVGTDAITVIQFSGAGTYSAGTGLDLTGTVFSHEDTSSQASVNNSGNTFIQDVTLDDFGHVTALTSATAVINDGTLTMATSGTGLSGSAAFTANDSDNVTFTVTSNATSANTVSTIVARDASGNFSAGTITANLTGNASGNAGTATALATARSIGGVSFDGTADINLPGVNTAGNQSTSGNAATATKWATGRTISLSGDATGTSGSLDGSANVSITVTNAADQRGSITQIGPDTSDYYIVNATTHDWYLDGVLDMRLENDGDLHCDGDVVAYSTTTSSDEKLKDNIRVVEDSIGKLKQLRGVEFEWKKDGKSSAGVIAQDVEKVLPQAVKTVEDLNTQEPYKTVNYDALHALLIEAVKELSARVESLEAKLG
jgi:hypothetical protein